MERIVKSFYDGLEEGKLLGRKCVRCGAVEFPPVLACNSCGCLETEWVEVSGKAKMTDIIMAGVLSVKPEYEDLMPYCLACIEIEEGASFNSICQGVTKHNKDELLAQLPVPVKAKIVQREGYKTIVYELDLEEE